MKRRLLCWCKGLRNSSETVDTLIKEITQARNLQTQNPTTNATSVEVLITSSKTTQHGKMKKARETGRLPMKGNLSKTDFRKAMIAAWGEFESEAKIEKPVEEDTTNLCLMASHDSKTVKSKGKEVMSSSSFPKHLFSLDKYKFIELLMETR